MPTPSPKKRLSRNGPPRKAQQPAESVPLSQNASAMPSPNSRSTSLLRSAARAASALAIGPHLGLGEHLLEKGFVRRAGDDGDLLALDQFRQHVADRAVGARHETRRRAVIGIGEIGAAAGFRGRRDRGDHRVAPIVVERVEQRIEAARLDGASSLDLVAQQPRQIDVEAGRIAVGAGIVERRIIEVGEETDDLDARQIGPLRPPARIPKSRAPRRRAAVPRRLAPPAGRALAPAGAAPRRSGRRQPPTGRSESRAGIAILPF